jgi:hypothetical protein
MANNRTVIRALAGSAARIAERTGKTAQQVLQAAIDDVFENGVAGGKVVISTSEAGGSVNFALPQGRTQEDTIELLQRTLDFLAGKREIRRLRASFRQATTS